MSDFFSRRGAAYINEMNRSLGELLGLVQSLQQLVGGTLSEIAASIHVTQMLSYKTPQMVFSGAN